MSAPRRFASPSDGLGRIAERWTGRGAGDGECGGDGGCQDEVITMQRKREGSQLRLVGGGGRREQKTRKEKRSGERGRKRAERNSDEKKELCNERVEK